MVLKGQLKDLTVSTGVPGLTWSAYISKDGGNYSLMEPSPVTEGNLGLYIISLTTTDTDADHISVMLVSGDYRYECSFDTEIPSSPTDIATAVWANKSSVDLTPETLLDVQTGIATSTELDTHDSEVKSALDDIYEYVAYIATTSNTPSGTGTSGNPYIYTAVDSLCTIVAGATISVFTDYECTQSILGVSPGTTDTFGKTTFTLPSGRTYYVVREKEGVTFYNPDIWKIE
jgi:hypothetical protein